MAWLYQGRQRGNTIVAPVGGNVYREIVTFPRYIRGIPAAIKNSQGNGTGIRPILYEIDGGVRPCGYLL
jgi:hypothetical protein